MKIVRKNYIYLLSFFLLLAISPITGQADELQRVLRSTIRKYSSGKAGISVTYAESGKPVFSYNDSVSLKPASVQKILTSVVAIKKLRPDFRFKTWFYGDKIKNAKTDNLYVLGGGDPNLRTEDLWIISKKLKRTGIRSVGNIVLDSSAFVSDLERRGQRAYEAGSDAISFNFNSITFEICTDPSSSVAQVHYEPSELNIPLQGKISVVRKGRSKFGIDELPGKFWSYRLQGKIRARNGCSEVYRSVPDPALYFGATLIEYLKLLRVQVSGKVRKGHVAQAAELLFDYESKALDQIIEDLNRFSNNFIGEQLVAAVGMNKDGRMDRELGLALLAEHLENLGFEPSEFIIADGSGLSHLNRLSARILTTLLNEVQDLPEIQPEFEKSLSVGGRSGTLKDRKFRPESIVIRGKTGTLNGVSALAGYLYTKNGRKLSFAILQNGIKSKSRAHLLEEKLLIDIVKANI